MTWQSGVPLKERPPQTAYTLGVAFALNGEPDRAFEWLEQALKLSPQNREALRADARLNSLRADPRFKAFDAVNERAGVRHRTGQYAIQFYEWRAPARPAV
jgi:Tfp pilus assembly protein PilF